MGRDIYASQWARVVEVAEVYEAAYTRDGFSRVLTDAIV